MFVILREKSGSVFDEPLMDIYELVGFVESDTADLVAIRKEFGDGLMISEQITCDFDAMKSAIPGELDRAIDAWNDRIVGKLKFAKKRITARSHYVDAFRKWKKGLGKRDYFLWQLVDDLLAANDFTQAWMRFGLFFAKKNGEYHSDLFRAGQYRDPSRRPPEPERREWTDEEKREYVKWARDTKAQQGGLGPMSEIHLRSLEEEGY